MSNTERIFKKRHKALPLRSLALRSVPFAKRALSWSPDAELAVAADDSVYVFVPQFGGEERDGDEEEGEGEDPGDEHEPGKGSQAAPDDDPLATETETRSQFAAGSLHIPVAYPPLDARINYRLYAAAGLPFPMGNVEAGAEAAAAAAAVAQAKADAKLRVRGQPRGGAVNVGGGGRDEAESYYRRPGGAGSGTLTAVAGTMNSVVAVAWSPAGVGRNRRAVLGVLTAAGVVTVYGEGEDVAGKSSAGGGSAKRHYSTARWEVLWAVGERQVVPPQMHRGECIVSFAWSGALETANGGGGGGALLLYRTDQGEVAVLRVRRHEEGVWHVDEAARFDATGPHRRLAAAPAADAHFVPDWGTSFGLSCSPWLAVSGSKEEPPAQVRVCLVGYLAHNYVGFRRVTVTAHGDGRLPTVVADAKDVDGLCLFLGADAFLVWEDGLWQTTDDGTAAASQAVCRGVVATPMVARAFEVVLAAGPAAAARGPPPPHDLVACGTTYPSAGEACTNPIQDLVIHPPSASPSAGGGQPAYTLVRLAATATNSDWYETGGGSVPADPDSAADAWPQWTREVALRVRLSSLGQDEADAWMDEDTATQDLDDPAAHPLTLTAAMAAAAAPTPELYLHRARLWGLALAPGSVCRSSGRGHGGVTAVLVTEHAAQHAERSGWYRERSRVLFGWRAEADEPDGEDGKDGCSHRTAGPPGFACPPVSTEARMWAWMYDGGSPPTLAVQGENHRAPLRQTCTICGAPFKAGDGEPVSSAGAVAVCERGHVFDRCGATGLAIQRPGVSRVCGVCGRRTLLADAVAAMVEAEAEAETLRQAVAGDVCGRCGGKFND